MPWRFTHGVHVILFAAFAAGLGGLGAHALAVQKRQPIEVADVYQDSVSHCAGCCGGDGSLKAFVRSLNEQRLARAAAALAPAVGELDPGTQDPGRIAPGARGGPPPGAHGFARCCQCASGSWSSYARKKEALDYEVADAAGAGVVDPAKLPPADVEVLTVDVELAKLVRDNPAAFAARIADLLGVPVSRISVDLPEEPRMPTLPMWPPAAPAPAPAPPPGLAPSLAGAVPADALSAAALSSPSPAGDGAPICYETDVEFACNDVNESSWEASPQACQDRCGLVAECNFFTYFSDSGDCYLKSSDAGRTTVLKAFAGPKFGCYWGSILPPAPAPSPAPAPAPAIVVAEAWEEPCIQTDVEIQGAPVATCRERRTTQPSSLDCQAACARSAECEFFTWWVDSHNCWLKTSSAGRTEGVPLAVSGPKVCEDVAVAPAPAPAAAPLYYVEMLTRDPCLIRGLRGRRRYYQREIAAVLNLSAAEVTVEPPATSKNSVETSCGIDDDIMEDPGTPDAAVAALISRRARTRRPVAQSAEAPRATLRPRATPRPPSLRGAGRGRGSGLGGDHPAALLAYGGAAGAALAAAGQAPERPAVRLAFYVGGVDYAGLMSNSSALADFDAALRASIFEALAAHVSSSAAGAQPSPPWLAPAPAPAPAPASPPPPALSPSSIDLRELSAPEPDYVAVIAFVPALDPNDAGRLVRVLQPFTVLDDGLLAGIASTASLAPYCPGPVRIAGMEVDVVDLQTPEGSSVPLSWLTGLAHIQPKPELEPMAVRLAFLVEGASFAAINADTNLFSQFRRSVQAAIAMTLAPEVAPSQNASAPPAPAPQPHALFSLLAQAPEPSAFSTLLSRIHLQVLPAPGAEYIAVLALVPVSDIGQAGSFADALQQSPELNATLVSSMSAVIASSAAATSSGAVAIGAMRIDIVNPNDPASFQWPMALQGSGVGQPGTTNMTNTMAAAAESLAVRVACFVRGLDHAALQADGKMSGDFRDSVAMTLSMALEPPPKITVFLAVGQGPTASAGDIDVAVQPGRSDGEVGVLAFVPVLDAADATRVDALLSPSLGLGMKLAMTLDGMSSLDAARSGDIAVEGLEVDVVDLNTPGGREPPLSWQPLPAGLVAPAPAPMPPEPMNRAWVAVWRVGLPYQDYEIFSQRLVAMVNTPHGPFDELLPLTLARFPGVGLVRPRPTSLHLGAMPAGDMYKHLLNAALAAQERAHKDIEYGLAIRDAIRTQEAKLGEAIHGMAHAMTAEVYPHPEVAPPNLEGRSRHGPWKPGAPLMDRGFGL